MFHHNDLDAKIVLALLIGAIRADRFCEETLLGFVKSGAIQRWLGRLKEFDNENVDEWHPHFLMGKQKIRNNV